MHIAGIVRVKSLGTIGTRYSLRSRGGIIPTSASCR